jgi:hypothetical protein
MNYKEQADFLMDTIQQLMALYKDICDHVPQLLPAYNSEVKKMPRTCLTFRGLTQLNKTYYGGNAKKILKIMD